MLFYFVKKKKVYDKLDAVGINPTAIYDEVSLSDYTSLKDKGITRA